MEFDGRTIVDVRCQVITLSFSAHADAKGISQLIKMAQPQNVLLVHGEKEKMCQHQLVVLISVREYMKHKVTTEFGIQCYNPPNEGAVVIEIPQSIPIALSTDLVSRPRLRITPPLFTEGVYHPCFG